MDHLFAGVSAVLEAGFGPHSRLWPFYLITTLLIGFLIYSRRAVGQSFLSWLLPKSVWLHPSHIVDVKLFLVTRILAAAGFLNIVAIGAFLATFISGFFPEGGVGLPAPHPVVIGLMLLIVGDFATYWVHRIHHEVRILWPFHSLHHSAEVMTPITVYRKHPFYDLSKSVIRGGLLGVTQGVLIGLFPGGVSIQMLMGVNAGYLLFNMLGANFRHTHVWLSYGPLLEHVLISPAQHQIHHSLAPRHHNKNYGEVLAVWDWMFGSLYIPQQVEILEFGLGDSHGHRLNQRHDSLASALIVPVKDSLRQIRKLAGKNRKTLSDPVTPAE